ncbi:AraC family transcriptional regulator [Photobacterium sp. WH77]|uniref:AraC family transcriptional regulator n=1 Tax=unclassified Photobacterium TaxID=2628852 RepID=UPI001EDA0FCF|nr:MULTISPECIES: AraC family transcriptional regulator [unclassified Photobacterium]MCG2838311.1 AraC family transcriptional regulator [Photobacterium sp. WH77]MCG2845974.1 AraC family transcriptional regulator [Photobacterium sp. WH80]
MNSPASPSHTPKPHHFTRIQRVLDYIHTHLDQPLSVVELAEQSCWSRWQLQRVFNSETGLTLAQYVRELKLSRAAEQLLSGNDRILDIALSCGFNSEISFIRAFRQMFGCAPGSYKKRGLLTGLRTPLQSTRPVTLAPEISQRLLQIRLERRPAFQLFGVSGKIHGLFADNPDYPKTVPTIWHQFHQQVTGTGTISQIGVIDTQSQSGDALIYWAGILSEQASDAGLHTAAETQCLNVPEQLYAVIPYSGPIHQLDKVLHWFIAAWLPESSFKGIDGYELEIYPPQFDVANPAHRMEYWMPVEPA